MYQRKAFMHKIISLSALLLFAACTPSGTPNESLQNTAIDTIIASSNKSCIEETSKDLGAEMAGKICGCVSSKVGEELKKDPSAVTDQKKLEAITPGVTAACIKELTAKPAESN
jgi:hypothetical protein